MIDSVQPVTVGHLQPARGATFTFTTKTPPQQQKDGVNTCCSVLTELKQLRRPSRGGGGLLSSHHLCWLTRYCCSTRNQSSSSLLLTERHQGNRERLCGMSKWSHGQHVTLLSLIDQLIDVRRVFLSRADQWLTDELGSVQKLLINWSNSFDQRDDRQWTEPGNTPHRSLQRRQLSLLFFLFCEAQTEFHACLRWRWDVWRAGGHRVGPPQRGTMQRTFGSAGTFHSETFVN